MQAARGVWACRREPGDVQGFHGGGRLMTAREAGRAWADRAWSKPNYRNGTWPFGVGSSIMDTFKVWILQDAELPCTDAAWAELESMARERWRELLAGERPVKE